jgi:hypothetical protein
VVENLLELGGGSPALSGCQVRLTANVRVIEAGNVGDETDFSQFDCGGSRLQRIQGESGILTIQR